MTTQTSSLLSLVSLITGSAAVLHPVSEISVMRERKKRRAVPFYKKNGVLSDSARIIAASSCRAFLSVDQIVSAMLAKDTLGSLGRQHVLNKLHKMASEGKYEKDGEYGKTTFRLIKKP